MFALYTSDFQHISDHDDYGDAIDWARKRSAIWRTGMQVYFETELHGYLYDVRVYYTYK